jgi:hypothetical protein
MNKSALLFAAMIAVPVIFVEILVLPVAANAATSYECDLRRNYCKGGCSGTHREFCRDQCDEIYLTCLEGATDRGSTVLEKPKNPKGRPITGAKPQGVMPAGGLLDTTPGFRGQGPAATGGAGINARPSAPPQIR